MKKITLVSIISFSFFLLSSILTYCLKGIDNISPWKFFIPGVAVLVVSGIIALIFKEKVSIACLLINSVSLGLLIKAWYLYTGYTNSLLVMILLSLACLLYIWIFYGLIQIPFIEKHINGFALIFAIISVIAYILIIIFTKTTFMSTLGYYSIINMAFVLCLCMNMKTNKSNELFKNMMIASFSVAFVGVIIALIMLEVDDVADVDILPSDFNLKNPKKEKIN